MVLTKNLVIHFTYLFILVLKKNNLSFYICVTIVHLMHTFCLLLKYFILFKNSLLEKTFFVCCVVGLHSWLRVITEKNSYLNLNCCRFAKVANKFILFYTVRKRRLFSNLNQTSMKATIMCNLSHPSKHRVSKWTIQPTMCTTHGITCLHWNVL